MPLVTLRLDRVFDLQRHRGSSFRAQHTTFCIESGGSERLGLRIEGWPAIREGTTITALLREPHDWRTLAGWIEHDSGEIVLRGVAGPVLQAAASIAAVGWCLWFLAVDGVGAASETRRVAIGIAVLMSINAAMACRSLWRIRADRALLRASLGTRSAD